MHRRLGTTLAASTLSLGAVFATATAAEAAPADKPQVLASWTQTSASSYSQWTAARSNQSAWSAYGYKAIGTFDANKSRIDSAFYEDLKRVCNNYSGATRTTCNSTAWTYYQAVRAFG
jgi:hypothetical protein